MPEGTWAERVEFAENGFGSLFFGVLLFFFLLSLGLGPKLQSTSSEVSLVNLLLFS